MLYVTVPVTMSVQEISGLMVAKTFLPGLNKFSAKVDAAVDAFPPGWYPCCKRLEGLVGQAVGGGPRPRPLQTVLLRPFS